MASRANTTVGLALIASLLGSVGAHTASAQSANPDPHRVEANTDQDTQAFLDKPSINEWRRQHASICLQAGEAADEPGEQYQQNLRRFLVQSPLMAQVFADLEDTDVTLCKGEETFAWNSEFTYRPDEDMVVLPFRGTAASFAAEAIEKIRHAWQDQRGAYASDPQNGTKQGYLADLFLRHGEAAAFTVAVAYELKEAGQPMVWDHLKRSVKTGPMARRFEEVITPRDQVERTTPLHEGEIEMAMRETYHAWYMTSGFQDLHRQTHAEPVGELPHTKDSFQRQVLRLAAKQAALIDPDQPNAFIGRSEIGRAVSESLSAAPIPRAQAKLRRP
ncbi:MAG: hypothetical protein KI792_09015 [Alphaproteobacteria bacterium]|nr:hypothetical protein [Alphaproteobacteria bacterium SS10]